MEIMILPFIGIFYIRNCVCLKTNPSSCRAYL